MLDAQVEVAQPARTSPSRRAPSQPGGRNGRTEQRAPTQHRRRACGYRGEHFAARDGSDESRTAFALRLGVQRRRLGWRRRERRRRELPRGGVACCRSRWRSSRSRRPSSSSRRRRPAKRRDRGSFSSPWTFRSRRGGAREPSCASGCRATCRSTRSSRRSDNQTGGGSGGGCRGGLVGRPGDECGIGSNAILIYTSSERTHDATDGRDGDAKPRARTCATPQMQSKQVFLTPHTLARTARSPSLPPARSLIARDRSGGATSSSQPSS